MLQEMLGAAMALAGLGYVGYVTHKIRLAHRARSWPTAPGEILAARVEQKRTRTGNGNGYVYVANIEYAYEVRGRRYQGDTICIGGELDTSFEARAQERCRRYPVGRTVRVYHQPKDPQVCCLEPVSEMGLLGYAIGAAVTIIGFLISMKAIGPS